MKLLSGSEIAARLWQNKNPPHSQSTRAIPFKYFELQKRRTKLKNFITKYFSGVPSVAKVTNLLFLLRSFETLSARNREQERNTKLVRDLFFMCRQIIAILNMEGDLGDKLVSYITLPSCLGLRVNKYQVFFQTLRVLLSVSESLSRFLLFFSRTL